MSRAERQKQPVKYAMLRGKLVPREEVLRAQIAASDARAEPAPEPQDGEVEDDPLAVDAPKRRGRPRKSEEG